MFSLNIYFSTYVTLLAFHPSALDRPQPSRAEVACLLSFWQPSTAPRTSHHQSPGPSSPSLLLIEILSAQPTSASITDLAGNVCSHHIPPSIDTCPHHQPSLSSVFSLSNEAPSPPPSEKLCLQNNNAATATHPVIVFCSCPSRNCDNRTRGGRQGSLAQAANSRTGYFRVHPHPGFFFSHTHSTQKADGLSGALLRA